MGKDCSCDSLTGGKGPILTHGVCSLDQRHLVKLLLCTLPIVRSFRGKKTSEDAQQNLLLFNPVCQSSMAREEQRINFTSSGGVFSYTLCSFRGTTCFLVLCGTNFYHEMFHLHPSSLPLGYTPADPGLGLWLQQQECCRLALKPVLSLPSAGASVRRVPLLPLMGNADKAIATSKV